MTKIDNILRVYYAATDFEKEIGLKWYKDARKFALDLSKEYKLRFETAAAVIAALSPLNQWERNKNDAIAVIKYHREFKRTDGLGQYPKSTTPKKNIAKAVKILETGKLSYLTGEKVNCFYHNIINPNSNRVTIDRHAIGIALNDRKVKTVKDYGEFEQAYRDAAKITNLRPSRLQAICWVVWRLRDFNQLTLF